MKRIAAILISVIMMISICGCGSETSYHPTYLSNFGKTEEDCINTDDQSEKTVKVDSSGDISEEISVGKSSAKKTNKEYSIKTSFGETLTASSGYTAVALTKTVNTENMSDAGILIPYLADYTSDGFSKTLDFIGTDGICDVTLKFDKKTDFDFLDNYIKAIEKCGFTAYEKSKTMTKFEYKKSLKHEDIYWGDSKTDLCISTYKDGNDYYMFYKFCQDIGFDYGDFGKTSESKSVTVKTSHEFKFDKEHFLTKGYYADSETSIRFDTNVYPAGSPITLDDFISQYDGGAKQSLCFLYVKVGKDYLDLGTEIKSAKVSVLETEGPIAISFVIDCTHKSDKFLIEGVCVSDVDEVVVESVPVESSGISSSDISCISCGGTHRCKYCGGTGGTKCSKCSGTGLINCNNCGGIGYYYENSFSTTPGIYKRCTRCNGSGSFKCTAFGCSGGKISCSTCGGSGKCKFCS